MNYSLSITKFMFLQIELSKHFNNLAYQYQRNGRKQDYTWESPSGAYRL